MGKSSYPDALCMVGRSGHFEAAINGIYHRMKNETKKSDVRLFYEKGDGVLLCYGGAAWAEEKPPKGWMIGWWDTITTHADGEAKDEKVLFIAARCRIADPQSSSFLWEVRDEEGEFVSDESTQLVLLPEKDEASGGQSPGKVTLRLADEVGLRPEGEATPGGSPGMAGYPAGSPIAFPSPFFPMGMRFDQPPFQEASWEKGKKKKKGKGGNGLRAEAPAFVPGMAGMSPHGGMYPPQFPFMPMMPSPDLARVAARAQPIVAINKKYTTDEEEKETADKQKKAQEKKQADQKPQQGPKGMTLTSTTVLWELASVADLCKTCGKDGAKSPEFKLTKDGQTGPAMTVTFFPTGHSMSPPGCMAVMVECSAGVRMKFKVSAGSQASGAKVLMGNRFHVDFSGGSGDINFAELKVGLELLDWI